MIFQYIHTSAKRGLEPGKSGFCCVARDRDVPPDLIHELEQQSRYFQSSKGKAPTVLRHRIKKLRSGKYHILSRIQDSGADYSMRNNHIAHHLAFTTSEITALPNPAAILLNWTGWRDIWNEPPRVLSNSDTFNLNNVDMQNSPTDSYGDFPPAIKYGEALARAFDISIGEEFQLIEHIRDSLKELRFKEQWSYAFTSALLPTDRPEDYAWSGVWNKFPLPYEVDFRPRSLGRKSPPRSRKKTQPQKVERSPKAASQPVGKNVAPVVEIPAEFNRKQRRRPKRKFGHRELLKSINISLIVGGLFCAAVAIYFYRNNQSDMDTLVQSRSVPNVPVAQDPIQNARTMWRDFTLENYPIGELEIISSQTRILAGIGETQPSNIIAFLRLLKSKTQLEWPRSFIVPNELIDKNSSTSITRITLSPKEYTHIESLALAPAVIASKLQVEEIQGTDFRQVFADQNSSRFDAELFVDRLQEFKRSLSKSIINPDSNALRAMEQFIVDKETLLASDRFIPFLKIHEAFDLPESAAYIAFDQDGQLSSGSSHSFTEYLVNLFTDQVLANYDTIRNTTAFKAAFSQVNNEDFNSPFEAAQAIHNAMLLIDVTTRKQEAKWQKSRAEWSNAFVRSDLMESTIVSYTVEAFEDSKRSLFELQNQFSKDDLLTRARLMEMQQQIDELEQLARSAAIDEEWVVFDKQNHKVEIKSP